MTAALKPSSKQLSLREQAHAQTMELLRLGDKSKNPAIAKAAIALAQERSRNQYEIENRISPKFAVVSATTIAVLACGACWFAITHYSGKTSMEIVWVIAPLAILIICLFALFSGHLSQANFMTIFKWVGDRFKKFGELANRFLPKGTSPETLDVSANEDSK